MRPRGLPRKNLARALELDDTIGEAYDTLGVLSWSFDWDWDAADRAFNRALELAPSYSCAHEDRAIFLAFPAGAPKLSRRSQRSTSWTTGFSSAHTESAAYFELRDYPRLIEASRRGLLLDPTDSSQHYYLGAGYEGTGKFRKRSRSIGRPWRRQVILRAAVALAHA